MDFADLKNKIENDLKKELADGREVVRQLRFQAKGGHLKNVRGLRNAKKTIAKIKTAISQKLGK